MLFRWQQSGNVNCMILRLYCAQVREYPCFQEMYIEIQKSSGIMSTANANGLRKRYTYTWTPCSILTFTTEKSKTHYSKGQRRRMCSVSRHSHYCHQLDDHRGGLAEVWKAGFSMQPSSLSALALPEGPVESNFKYAVKFISPMLPD